MTRTAHRTNILITYYPGTGIAEERPEVRMPKLEVLPNPAAGGIATLRVQGLEGSRVRVQVFDAAGRCALVPRLVTANCSLGTPLDLRKVPAGIYLVRLDAYGLNATQRLVVQR